MHLISPASHLPGCIADGVLLNWMKKPAARPKQKVKVSVAAAVLIMSRRRW